MIQLLVTIYDLSPYRGSEAAVGWNYVIRMHKHVNLTVIYGRGKIDMDRYLSEHPMPDTTFINIEPKDALKYPRGIRQDYYDTIFYTQWHKQVYAKVLELTSNRHFDIIHHLSPIGFKEPGYLWKIKGIPFVWGPLMCVENRPFKLYRVYSLKNKILALIRRIVHNAWFRFVPRINNAFKTADQIFAVTPNGMRMIKRIHGRESILMPENCIIRMATNTPISYASGGVLNIIWVGRVFDQSKGLEILLDALMQLPESEWHLNIIGDGNLPPKKMQKFASINHKITWHGKISRENVLNIFSISHLHVITSLGEATTTVIWEAMANAIPTMTLDHCGMAGVVCDKCGIKIPIERYDKVVANIASHINNIIKTPSEIKRMSTGVLECSKKFMWDNRIQLFLNTYQNLIDKKKHT